MRKVFLIAALLAGQALGQKAPGLTYYHLDFVVKELDAGKVVNSRTYTTSTDYIGNCAIRAGDRLPIRSNNTTTYIDVGVNIDCNSAVFHDEKLALHVSADISSVASEKDPGPPIIHQTKWSSVVLVPIGKPTTVFSSDGPMGKRQTQLEMTVTAIP